MKNVELQGTGYREQGRVTAAATTQATGALRRARGAVLAALVGIGVGGCTDLALYDLDILLGNVPIFSYMRTSVAVHPHEMPRLPADGSIPASSPRGDVPAPFSQAELTSAEVTGLDNPLDPTAEVLARGQQLYAQHCFACHGAQGLGDGPVVGPGRFPFALPTNAAVLARYTDGYLYGIIRVGRGLMPAYGDRMTHLDRWALVHYLRHLGVDPGAVVPPAAPIAPAANGTGEAAPQGAAVEQGAD